MVPAAADRGTREEEQHRYDGGGEDDVAHCADAHFAEGGVRGEAEVEEEHGELGEGIGNTGDCVGGVAELWCCVSGNEQYGVVG